MSTGAAPDPVAGHLVDAGQREEIARLGIWLFLSTEVLLFGGLFLGFTIYRMTYPEAFVAASRHLNVWLGTANTLVLLTSSLSAALAVSASQQGNRRLTAIRLAITGCLALAFLAIKACEWRHEFNDHLVPGINFDLPGMDSSLAAHQQLFFCFYFIMTGLHALHMLVGTAIIGWLALSLGLRNSPLDLTMRIRVDSVALYWHFVDIVWVFLLPLLYLTGIADT